MQHRPPSARPFAPHANSPVSPETQPAVRVPLVLEDALSAGLLALLAIITMANVAIRYLTDQSFAWTEEISLFLMVVMTLAASSAATARQRHIAIEFFVQRSAASARRRYVRLAAGCTAAAFWLMAVLSARLTWEQYIYGDISPAIGVPEWWYSIWMPLLCLAIALRACGVWRRA